MTEAVPATVAQRLLPETSRYELNISDYWRIIMKRRLVILISFVSVLIAAIIYTNTKTPLYRTSAEVRIAQGPRAFQYEGGMFLPNSTDQMAVYSNMIMSDDVLQRVVVRLGLLAPNATAADLAEKTDEIRGAVSTESDDVSGTLSIVVTHPNPELAAAIANQTAAMFVEVDLLEKTRQARKLRGFIQEQLDVFTRTLQTTEDKLREFRQAGRALGIAAGMEQRLSDMEKEKNLLLKQYTERHPDIIKLEDQIESLRERIRKLPADELELARLQRELEINDRAYRTMKEKYESARLAEVEKVSDVTVMQTASAPAAPIFPQKNANKLAGAIVGLVAGIVLALLSENLDTSIGTIEDVERIVRLPVIGIIPFFQHGSEEIPWWRLDLWVMRFFSMQPDKAPDSSYLIMNQDTLSSLSESYRILRTFVEFLIGKETTATGLGKVLVITSTGPQEGKTLTVCNLAISLAQAGKRVLLIDADLRRPTLHRLFGLTRSPGLTDILLGTTSFQETRRTMGDILVGDTSQWDHVLTTKMLDRLEIIPTGTHTTTPAELLESDAMKRMIEEARHQYAYIIIDTPPVLPVTDARTLGTIADAVFFIYRSGKTARRALTRAKDELNLAGIKVRGIILNYATPETTLTDAYYYQYYGEGKQPKQKKRKEAKNTTLSAP